MSYDPVDTAAVYILAILALFTLAAILADVVLVRWIPDREELELELEERDAFEREHLYAPIIIDRQPEA